MSAAVTQLTAWLLTYALHSTLLLTVVWLVCRRLGKRALPTQEVLWKTALVGGLVTASLQLGLGAGGLGADGWTLQDLARRPAEVATAAPAPAMGAPRPGLAVPAKSVELSGPTVALPSTPPSDPPAAAADDPWAFEAATLAAWPAGVAALWLLGALLCLAWLAASYGALAHRLRGRSRVTGGAVHHLFTTLSGYAKLTPRARLTASTRAPAPLAQGVLRPEVCLPVRVLAELTEGQQETLLAHEMGHLARRDPAWLLAARVLEGLFFFQPLNRLARMRLQEIAEYRADDWAVTATGRPLDLARCLTRVAGWHLPAVPVPAIAEGRSGLGRRVHRLLNGGRGAERAPRGLLWAAAATLALVVAVAPGVTAGPEPNPDAPAAIAGTEAPEPPEAPAAPEAPETREVREAPEWEIVEPPEPPNPPSPPSEDEWMRGFDAEMERFGAEMEAFGEEMAAALAPLEDLGDRIAEMTDGLDEELEAAFEGFEEQMDDLMSPRFLELAEKHEAGTLTPEERAELDALRVEVEAHAQRARELAEVYHHRLAPLHEEMGRRLGEELPRLIERSMPDPEALRAIAERAQEVAAHHEALSLEQRQRLREEARRLAEAHRLSREELVGIREEARRIAEESLPSREELEELRVQVRRDMEAARAELDRHRSEVEAERQRARAEAERQRRQERDRNPDR